MLDTSRSAPIDRADVRSEKQVTQTTNKKNQWRLQRILIGVWVAGFASTIVALAYPISTGILRSFIVTAIPGLWALAIFLARRVKWLTSAILAAGIVVGIFAVLPGRRIDPDRLQSAYVTQLKQYEGAPYAWGGENGRGIDCSGLVRRALVNAYLRTAFTTGNPKAMRAGLNLWWHDCSALALRDQYRHFTTPVFTAPSINAITNSFLLPGDIAVTSSGIHVLAYLGGRKWIQADPGIMKVITLAAPSDNAWFNVAVHIMRWADMQGTASGQTGHVFTNHTADSTP